MTGPQFRTTGSTGTLPATNIAVKVQDIDTKTLVAQVIDQLGVTYQVPLTRLMGKPVDYPQPGEQWIITNQYGGVWTFAVSINVPPPGPNVTFGVPFATFGAQGYPHDDTAAFLRARDALKSTSATKGGGTLLLEDEQIYIGSIALDNGFSVMSSASFRGIDTGIVSSWTTKVVAPPGATSGYHVDTPNTPTYGCSVRGILFESNGQAGLGGVRFQNAQSCSLEHVAFMNYSSPGVRLTGCTSPVLNDVRIDSADPGGLGVYRGALHVDSTVGGAFRAVQANYSDRETVHYAGNYYRCSIYLGSGTQANTFYDTCGEYGDVGWVLDTGVVNNSFIGSVASTNAAHGWVLNSGANGNTFMNARALNNGLAAFSSTYTSHTSPFANTSPAVYHGFLVNSGAITNQFDGCQVSDYTPRNTYDTNGHVINGPGHRLAFNDRNILSTQVARTWNRYSNNSFFGSTYDRWGSASYRACSEQNVNGPNSGSGITPWRPSSIAQSGKVWVDLGSAGTSTPKPTFSSGSAWVDYLGNAQGNLLTYDQANARSNWVGNSGTLVLGQQSNTPIDRPCAATFTTTAASSSIAPSTAIAIQPSTWYAFGVSVKSSVARAATPSLTWQNSSFTSVGTPSTVTGTATTTQTAWDDSSPVGTGDMLVVVVGQSPAASTGVTQVVPVVAFTGATGDVHSFCKAFLVNCGTGASAANVPAGFIEP